MAEGEHGALLAVAGASIFDGIGPTLKDGTILVHGEWVATLDHVSKSRRQMVPK